MQFQIPPQLGQVQGRVAQLWNSRPQFVKENPLLIGAGLLGGVAANQVLDNPVGGLIDAITFGATNLRPDESLIVPQSVGILTPPQQQPPQLSVAQQYVLNDEDKARAMTNLKRKIATDLITIHALKGEDNV